MMMDDNQIKINDKDDDKDEERMDDEENAESADPVKSIKAFKELVVKTLEENDMHEKRAIKMEIMDFLNLLKVFNEKGIHFKWLTNILWELN